MFQNSIRRKIVGIAVGLIILMVVTSALSMLMEARIGHLLDEQTTKYFPAYSHLARANIRSLERAIVLRRMVIAKLQNPPDEISYAENLKIFDQKGPEIEQEAEAAKKLIVEIINDVSTPSDNAALARIETRIDNAVNDLRHRMNDENAALLAQFDAKDFAEVRRGVARIDRLRDEFNQKIDMIRADMRSQVDASAAVVIRNQQRAIMISGIVTALAAIMGLVFAMLVSG
ncbi:MAG: adenylate/guanylate cyclase domain-containing protein, partial [Pseudolabrys sp.]